MIYKVKKTPITVREALDKWRSRLETVMAETLIYHWIDQKPRYGRSLTLLQFEQNRGRLSDHHR